MQLVTVGLAILYLSLLQSGPDRKLETQFTQYQQHTSQRILIESPCNS
jgi:hypothetical protein